MVGGPVVVGDGEFEHEGGHHEESHDLDPKPPDDVDEGHTVPQSAMRVCARTIQNTSSMAGGGLRYPPDGTEDVFLEQVLGVEGDVEEEPGGGGAEVEAVATDELLGEEAEVVGPVRDQSLCPFGILLEFHVEDLGHVGRRLLSIPLRRARCRASSPASGT